MKVRELIKKLADRNMDAEVVVSTGDTYNDVSDFCLSWGGPHSTDSEKDHRDEEFVYIDFFEDIRENAALPDVPVDERIRDAIALVLTDVDERVLFSRGVTLKAALDWLGRQAQTHKTKEEKDAEELKRWLRDRSYSFRDSEIVKLLRKPENDWDD